MKVFAFIGLNWSVHRVILGIEKQLPDSEFRYMESGVSYSFDEFKYLYHWCDVMLTNLETIRITKQYYSNFIDNKKVLYISHGAIENEVVKDQYDPRASYGMASECLQQLFPPNLKLYVTPNGVDPSLFKYSARSGSLQTIGWCGCPNIGSKRVEFAHEISKQTEVPLRIGYGMSFEQTADWYHTIDLLIITAGPDIYAETGPLPAFEAIVCGIPVIGTCVGNFAKIPGPKFFNVDDAVSMINYLKDHPQRMIDIAIEQRAYVLEHFTYEKVAPLWKRALEFS